MPDATTMHFGKFVFVPAANLDAVNLETARETATPSADASRNCGHSGDMRRGLNALLCCRFVLKALKGCRR